MDIASIFGLVIGLGCLAMGYATEGGSLKSLIIVSAAMIVFGGSLGAVSLSYGINQVLKIPVLFLQTFFSPKSKAAGTIDYIIKLAESARKDGLLSIEKILEDDKNVDPLLRRGLMMVIDGIDIEQIREIMEKEIYVFEERSKTEISTFESLGGYAPTFGMIGTIMGLVQVLSNMDSPDEMTSSIAVAFVATLYGVASANIIFLPTANKLKVRLKDSVLEKEMIIDGVCSIRDGMNPKMLRDKLSIYLQAGDQKPKKAQAGEKEVTINAKERKRA